MKPDPYAPIQLIYFLALFIFSVFLFSFLPINLSTQSIHCIGHAQHLLKQFSIFVVSTGTEVTFINFCLLPQ